MKGIISPKNIINLTSNNKILPANKLDKNIITNSVINQNNGYSNNFKKTFSNNKNDKKVKIESINLEYSSEKNKNYFKNLKDKIFSPINLDLSKNETKTKNLLLEITNKLNLNLTTKNSKKTLNNNINDKMKEFQSIKKISDTKIKYLPEKQKSISQKKTLILDLDETLIHSGFKSFISKEDISFNMEFDGKEHKIYVLKRPYLDEFLDKMSKLYEIVIFTASISNYANPLLNKLDKKKLISHRLFREHCTLAGNLFIKDLRKIGRELKDVIIIDNNPISYLYNKDNGIPIISWHSCRSDKELFKLIPLLELLSNVEDVRVFIRRVINGNFVNYSEVNKIIKNKKNRNGNFNNHNNINESNININTNNKSFVSENQKASSVDKNNEINSIKKIKIFNNINHNILLNNNVDKRKRINLSFSNHKFSNYYFNANERNSIREKIRESLNGDFGNRENKNLFEDKEYLEKYNNFYDLNSYSIKKSYIDLEKNEKLILPSNKYSKSLNNYKKNKNTFYNKLKEIKDKVYNDENERNSYSKFEHYHKFSLGISYRENNNNLNYLTSPSRTLGKKNCSLNNSHKNLQNIFKNYTTKVATIYLEDKKNKLNNNYSFISLTNRSFSNERNYSKNLKPKYKSSNGIYIKKNNNDI